MKANVFLSLTSDALELFSFKNTQAFNDNDLHSINKKFPAFLVQQINHDY